MRRIFLLLTMMAATLVVASGVALAVVKDGTSGDNVIDDDVIDDEVIDDDVIDTLLGPLQADELYGKAGDDAITGTNNENPRLVVQNKGNGVALRPLVKPGESPMAVNSDAKVAKERTNAQEERVGFNFGKIVLRNSSQSEGQTVGKNEIRLDDTPGDEGQTVGFLKIDDIRGESGR